MFFPTKLTQVILFVLTVLFIPLSLTAQDQACSFSPPESVYVTETDFGYTLEWPVQDEVAAYRVIVLNTETSEQIFDELVWGNQVEVSGLTFTPYTFVGIASVCDNGEEGEYGYFSPESNSTIIVQDIVMQMQGEDDPRILECEAETEQILATSVSSLVHTNFSVIPPSNGASSHQIQGAIVDIKLVDQNTGNVFAQSTKLAHANNTLLNAANPLNVSNNGNNYSFVNPANQHFFSYTNSAAGTFDFQISTVLPGDGSYQLLVEQRNCPNVNKIPQTREHGGHRLQAGTSGPTRPAAFALQRVSETTGITIYPNPTTDQLTIDVSAQEVYIFDSQGRNILRTVDLDPQQTIQVSHWPAGTYLVRAISTEGELLVSQFQKQ